MSLYKRGNVWWSYIYHDGSRYSQSTGTSNRKQAERIEDKLKQEFNDRRFQIVQSDPTITFGAVAARFVASGAVRPHHLYHLQFLLPFFSDIPALRVTKSLAEDFRKARHTANPAIKDATINRDLSVLRRVFNWALDEQLIAQNPLTRLKMARERRTRRQILSLAEEERLLGVAPDHLRAMIIIALDTGMRRGEITSQRWEDIDLVQKTLFVTHSKTPEGESREIPLTARLYEYFLDNRKPEGLVIDFRGRPIHFVQRAWRTALKHGGVRRVRFHDLRHTFATRMMEAGVMQEIRMELMGHSTGSKIQSIYTHIELPVKREAIRKLEQWVKDQQQQLQEKLNANSEDTGSQSATGEARAQTLEEKVARRNSSGAGRQAEGRDRRAGRGPESKTQTAPKVRRGKKTVRVRLDTDEAPPVTAVARLPDS